MVNKHTITQQCLTIFCEEEPKTIYQSVPQPRNSKVGVGKPTLEYLCWIGLGRAQARLEFRLVSQVFLISRLDQAKLFRSLPQLEVGFSQLEVFKWLEPKLKWLNQEFYTLQVAYFEWKLVSIMLKLLKIVYLYRKQARSRLDLKFFWLEQVLGQN